MTTGGTQFGSRINIEKTAPLEPFLQLCSCNKANQLLDITLLV